MNGDVNTPSPTEKFSKTTVFNPNKTKVILVSVKTSRSASTDEDIVCDCGKPSFLVLLIRLKINKVYIN